ncbi:DNA polymerase-4 [Sphingobacterium psychroaquaticum]|uniref:DNA polymerase IV n=2 Tax=Sphingobacterium psychroaquaticum TaxID=561061 RepID=A0A1X7II11_9SPHI|nr:DNA polymerase IV [Sphingobacterium psychroaquaticum]SMG14206.1 DNA polymerase-4 [Sphingobacterium psychroaquaticum]
MEVKRKIIHIDMDAFYASVDQRDFPELRGKPIAVGGSPDGRGVVATASYEARRFGVRSAMPSRQALQLCPDIIFTVPRFDAYKEVSLHIRSIFKRYTDLIEPLSLDEAYLDVTEDKLGIGSAIDIAKAIKDAIYNELDLTASAGVSVNKFVAKIASDYQKPNGLTFIGPSKVLPFLEQLPIEKFFGVGKVTAQKMKGMGIHNGFDLKQISEEQLRRKFGKSGAFLYQMVRGEDKRDVKPNRLSKSIGIEDTFAVDLREPEDMMKELNSLCMRLEKRLSGKSKEGRTVTLKIKYADFTLVTRSKTLTYYINTAEDLSRIIGELFAKVDLHDSKVRLLGVALSNFYDTDLEKYSSPQLRLFE